MQAQLNMSDLCVLCHIDISKGTNKDKRRRFDGQSDVQGILNELCREYVHHDIELKPLYGGYICYTCKKHVEKLPGLIK